MVDEHAADSQEFNTIAIVGVGLIGGSIAAAVRKRGRSERIISVGRNSDRLKQAREADLIDTWTTDVAEAASEADLMIFSTPVNMIAAGIKSAASHCSSGTLITDAGSVKGSICRDLSGQLPQGVTFIGSHPLAGSEKSGFEHADADLFEGRVCVVTPDDSTPRDQLQRLTNFWQSLGLTVVEMTPQDHDRALAATSHLPHVVATALALGLSDSNRKFSASGFADTTRIAAGDPDLWTAILLANADALLPSLDSYTHLLGEFRSAIAEGDVGALKKLLQVAKTNRDALDQAQR